MFIVKTFFIARKTWLALLQVTSGTHLLIPTVTLSGSITNTCVVTKGRNTLKANIQAFLVCYEWMTGSSNGPTYINATSSHQNALPSSRVPSEIILSTQSCFIETPVNRPVSPADLCMGFYPGMPAFFKSLKRNILWRLNDGLRLGKWFLDIPGALTFKYFKSSGQIYGFVYINLF